MIKREEFTSEFDRLKKQKDAIVAREKAVEKRYEDVLVNGIATIVSTTCEFKLPRPALLRLQKWVNLATTALRESRR